MSAKISVVMCTCPGAAFVEAQVRSIAEQTRLPDELVVTDDASSDDTEAVLRRMRLPFRLRIERNSSRIGVARNFAKAIAMAEGDILFLADQDDIWLPGKIEAQAALLEEKPELAAVVANVSIVDRELRPLGKNIWETNGFARRYRRQVERNDPFPVLNRQNIAPGMATAFRASWRSKILPIPEIWSHDHWILLLLSALAPIGLVHEPLVLYRQHGHQVLGATEESSLLRRAARASNTDRGDLELVVRQWDMLEKHMRSIGGFPEQALAAVEEKRRFFEARALLPNAKALRLPFLLSHLLNGAYFRFSAGLSSCAKDFLRWPR